MNKQTHRIAVVGASSLLGKDIAEELANGALAAATTVLLDREDASGKLEAVGDEATFVQQIEPGAFEGLDVAIFADASQTAEHWQTARQMGAALVDATGTLPAESAAVLRSPIFRAASGLGSNIDLQATTLAAAHPVATILALAQFKLGRVAKIRSVAATVLQPASEAGKIAMDELHQQTVGLLSFQPMPREIFDAQVAFNLLPSLGEAAKTSLAAAEQRVLEDLRSIYAEAPEPLLQLVQAPVFHGYAISLFVEFESEVTAQALEEALSQDGFELVTAESDPPSNVSAAGQPRILVRLPESRRDASRLAVWLAADNLRLTAQTAVACAAELLRLRPLGKVQ